MKTTTSITIDSDLLEMIKVRYPGEMSKIINKFLKELLNKDLNSKDKLELELKEREKKLKHENISLSIIKEKLEQINKENLKDKERQEQLIKDKAKEKEINKELGEPLTFDEIMFFKQLIPRSNDFDTNYYNNTFHKRFNEKQYLKRYKKYTDEVKK